MTVGANTPNDLTARLAELSPEKRALLAQRLAARSAGRGAGDGGIGPRAEETAPLSYAQELLWLYEQMTPGTAAYNVPLVRRVRGPLDVTALAHAVAMVIERHESLRTTFEEVDGVPVQRPIAPRASGPLTNVIVLHDVRALPNAEREAAATRWLQELAARPFDLARGTTPRVGAVRVADDEALLLVVVHHIVFDGGSVSTLFRDLAAAYDAALAHAAPDWPPLPIQLADYAAWERRELDDARLAPSIAYWRSALDGAPSSIELPTDFPRSPATFGPGARHAVTLGADVRAAVRSLATSQGATPFMVLLAAWQTVLHRYSGQRDRPAIGAPTTRSRCPE